MKKILNKVLTELLKDRPDLSYIRGLLEGLVDEEEKPSEVANILSSRLVIPTTHETVAAIPIDEAEVLDAKAKASIETIKALSEQSQSQSQSQ